MKSCEFSLEEKIVEAIAEVVDGEIPVVGFLKAAASGVLKEQDLTSVQVRVYGLTQPNEAMGIYSVSVDVRLMVEQAESANGALFFDMHEAIALYLQRTMLDDACVALSSAEAFVDGLQRNGGDADYDSSSGEWFAVWNLTLTGRLKVNNENTEEV